MTMHDVLPPAVPQGKAIVYVRQSTAQQVQTNLESQRRQHELVDVASRRGFNDVEIVDDDLGRSASGTVERPGFERLVAALCAGKIGAVLCLDASRLARNGRSPFFPGKSNTAGSDLTGLADDLEAAWKAQQTTMRTRQRLVRAPTVEIVADVDQAVGEIVLVIHWKGGQHSELRVKKPKTGEHGCRTSEDAVAVMRRMADRWSDEEIAASLNRMEIPTGQGKTWTAHRVRNGRYCPVAARGINCPLQEIGPQRPVLLRLGISPNRKIRESA